MWPGRATARGDAEDPADGIAAALYPLQPAAALQPVWRRTVILTFDSLPAAGLRDLLHLRDRDLAAANAHRRSSMVERSRSYRSRNSQLGRTPLSENARACRISKVAARERDQAAELLAGVL